MKENHLINYLLLLGIGILWGSQFMFNDIAIRTMPPEIVATCRVLFGLLCLIVLSAFFDRKHSAIAKPPLTKSLAIRYLFIGIFEGVIPFFSIAWGQQYVDSSVTAVLVGTIPIFTGLWLAIFVRSEKHTIGSILSIIVGFIGLLVLLSPSLTHADFTHLAAEGAILLGALSFSIALVLIKTMPSIGAVRMTRNVFGIAAVPLVIYALIVSPQAFIGQPLHAWLAVATLGILCSGVVYILYVTLIAKSGAGFAALSNYLVPLFGTLIGVSVLGDKIHWTTIAALVIILGSLVLHKIKFKK